MTYLRFIVYKKTGNTIGKQHSEKFFFNFQNAVLF